MAYQDFPWQKGSSRSFEKLLSLSLPVLRGKSVLDVGCNDGFFCGWAAFQKAAYVHGIDHEVRFIEQARLWFPGCRFSCGDWTKLGPRKYDVILCLSAIHYAWDQEALLRLLLSRLTDNGLLILELGVAEGEAAEFVPVARSISAPGDDSKLFPTFAKIESMLQDYAFKYMGQSVLQAGDPLPRHVFHVQRRRPLAVLFMDAHYSGKSSVANAILRPELMKIRGESVYAGIGEGRIPVTAELGAVVEYVPGTRHQIPPAITRNICEKGLLPELAAIFFALAGPRDFVLEHYIPEEYRPALAGLCAAAGYYVVTVDLSRAGNGVSWVSRRPPYSQYQAYLTYLDQLCAIDETAYLAANPDVAQAVADGRLPGAKYHYWQFGRREKRKIR